ncbi:MAG: FAD-dependent oxidoreductase, partial [Pseudomonadales bacterium]
MAAPSHTSSYYAASANDKNIRPALNEQITADICVIGAGYTGLSTALHLAESGFKVVVLEGSRIG